MRGQQKSQHSPSRLPALLGPLLRQDLMSFSACVSRESGNRASANSSGKLKVPSVEAAGAIASPGQGACSARRACLHPPGLGRLLQLREKGAHADRLWGHGEINPSMAQWG